jgi:DNA-binding transcriptional regulator PaaX
MATVLPALTGEWQRTQDIAGRLGIERSAAGHKLRMVRDCLYGLELHGYADHEERHNGHRWRLTDKGRQELAARDRHEALR